MNLYIYHDPTPEILGKMEQGSTWTWKGVSFTRANQYHWNINGTLKENSTDACNEIFYQRSKPANRDNYVRHLEEKLGEFLIQEELTDLTGELGPLERRLKLTDQQRLVGLIVDFIRERGDKGYGDYQDLANRILLKFNPKPTYVEQRK